MRNISMTQDVARKKQEGFKPKSAEPLKPKMFIFSEEADKEILEKSEKPATDIIPVLKLDRETAKYLKYATGIKGIAFKKKL